MEDSVYIARVDDLAPLPPKHSPETECDVLIAGAGPVGLLLGCHLRQLGIDTVIVDPHLGPGAMSKAAVTMPRSWEMLDLCGAAEPLREQCRSVKSLLFGYEGSWAKVFTGIGNSGIASRFGMSTLGQNYVERGLDKRFAELGGRMFRGARFLKVGESPNADRAEVDVDRFVYCRPPAQAPELPPRLRQVPATTFRAKFVVGCDGRQSALRRELGIEYPGKDYPQCFILADAELDDPPALRDHGLYVMIYEGRFLLMVHLQGKMWRVFYAASGIGPEHATTEYLETAWREMFPPGMVPDTVGWREPGFFSLSCCLASTYRSGRCLLAGDAAHCHSPAGGQGMNTGLQDAGNLAWKLAAVLKGHAPVELLDTYEQERRPVAEWVLQTSDTGMSAVTSSVVKGSLFAWLLRKAFIALVLPLLPSSLLPPQSLKHKLQGLSLSYAGAGTCVNLGQDPPGGAIAAGSRLPDCGFDLLPDNTAHATLLQLLAPISLKLRLVFVGPSWPASQEIADICGMVQSTTAWPEVEAWAINTADGEPEVPPTIKANESDDVAFSTRYLLGKAGAADLSKQLALPKGNRALLVVRPDGYIAVSHRGAWDSAAACTFARALATCHLAALVEE